MTREEFDCFKSEMKNDFREEMKANLIWTKWILGILIASILSFSIYVVKEIASIKENYITKVEYQKENDNLKLEITKKFSLPVQISQAQLKQIRAILDKNEKEYQQAKEDEYKLTQEMIRMNYDITTRGGEIHEPK
jgi:hypothetical protein